VAPPEPAIRAVGLRRVLDLAVPVTLVDGIDLEIAQGSFCAITGPSGSGKSSLLYLLGLLDRPTAGTIALMGRDTAGLAEGAAARLRLETLGFVFQFHFLLQELTVAENVALPMRRLGRLAEDAVRERTGALLEALGLGRHGEKRPDQLSGGERQRVAVARALANDPPIVLADEPTGSLDSKNSETVFGIFRRLSAEQGKTVVAVTHDAAMADRMDRRIHLIDGRIQDAAG